MVGKYRRQSRNYTVYSPYPRHGDFSCDHGLYIAQQVTGRPPILAARAIHACFCAGTFGYRNIAIRCISSCGATSSSGGGLDFWMDLGNDLSV